MGAEISIVESLFYFLKIKKKKKAFKKVKNEVNITTTIINAKKLVKKKGKSVLKNV